MMEIGTQLRQIRQLRKQTLAEVGAATDLSISYLSKIERSLTEPTLDALYKLSQHFDVSMTHFLEVEPTPENSSSAHLPSFREFIAKMNGRIDRSMQDLLLRIDAQAEKPAKTVDDWLQYYYVLSAVITNR